MSHSTKRTEKPIICVVQNSIRTLLIFRKEYIQSLVADGYTVFCIAPNDDEGSTRELESIGANVLYIPKKPLVKSAIHMNLALFRLNILHGKKIKTICHFITSSIMICPSLIFFRARNTVVIEGLGSFLHAHKKIAIPVKFLLFLIAKNRIFMNSFERSHIGQTKDAILGGIGIPISDFTSKRKKIGSPPRQLLYVGRLIKDKGIYDVLEVFQQLYMNDDSFKLDIVGDIYPNNPGSMTQVELEKIKNKFGENITFHGFQRNIVNFYTKADILLLLSYHEGFPVVVMEANCCGVPAIGYEVPGTRDAIVNGVNGYIVNKGDTRAVVNLLQSSPKENLIESSVQYAKNNFDRKKKNQTILKVVLSD